MTHSRGIAPHSVCPRRAHGRDRLPIFNLWFFTDIKISYSAGVCKVAGRKIWGKSCEALSAACGDSSPGGRAKSFTENRNRHQCERLLPLPLGEVSERSEDGEGIRCKTLSAACGDSSPRGRAKSFTENRNRHQCERLLPLPLGEVSERSEDGEGIRCKTPSVACGDSSPGGRAKGLHRRERRQKADGLLQICRCGLTFSFASPKEKVAKRKRA